MSSELHRDWDDRGGPTGHQRLLIRHPILAGVIPCVPLYAWAAYQGVVHGIGSPRFLTYAVLALLVSAMLVTVSRRASERLREELAGWPGGRDERK
jgi:hypothetical protein